MFRKFSATQPLPSIKYKTHVASVVYVLCLLHCTTGAIWMLLLPVDVPFSIVKWLKICGPE
jgi:hypothetical protein